VQRYYRFIGGLGKFARSRFSAEEAVITARSLLKKRIQSREENFLVLAERGIFGYSRSPYLKLLEPKRIRLSDFKSWVRRDGIESTLLRLADEGIRFTVDEFKGRTPVMRQGVNFRCDERMFDNPFLAHAYEVRSGATRSAGTRIRIDFDYLHQRSFYDAFLLDIHGCLTAPVANWFPVFPGAPGINSSLRFAHIGNPVRRWFSQVAEDQLKINWEKRLGTWLMFTVSSLFGAPLARPEHVGLNDAHKIVEWARQMLDQQGKCVIYTFAGSAVRICIAAAEANLSLEGVRFLVTGEPLTLQKRAEIESTGATAVPVYGISEAGVIAAGCDFPHPEGDCCHLYQDTTAIIPYPYNIPNLDFSVNQFLFTTLLYESPKLLVNVGMGDYGEIGASHCDCGFGRIGFHTAVSNIRSYEKLTGEGVTFVESDFVRIVEKHLPESFGGTSTDYQLVEEEDGHGLTQLWLLVSPRVGEINEKEARNKFLNLLTTAEDSWWAQSGTAMWKQAQMVRIKREVPIATASAKILPFYLLKPAGVVPAKTSTPELMTK